VPKIQFLESDDLIDIRYDNVFKAVFTRNTQASRGALSRLISALIDREVSVAEIIANEPPAGSLRDRQIRFDINCRANNNELLNVEMCFNPNPFEPVRLEFHAGKLFTGQDIRGTGKTYDDLKQTYQITILAKDRFFHDRIFLHTFEYYDPLAKMTLNGRTRIITLELSKVDNVVTKPVDAMNVKEYWAVYFRYLTDKSKRRTINAIVEREEGIAMASEVLQALSKDEVDRIRQMSELKYELDTQSRLVYAKREGEKRGEKKSKTEIARNALAKGISIELVQEITGLDIETIRNIQAKLA